MKRVCYSVAMSLDGYIAGPKGESDWMWQGIGPIEPLGVHPDYQGSGLGRALERSALQAFRNQGARYMYVDHVSTNEAGIALSLQNGFNQMNNAVRYFVRTSVGES